MAALPYIQLYVADYLADTMHLTTEEHGAYLLLIFNYWQTGKPIPTSRLARIARLSNDRWISVEASLKEFFNDDGEMWTHERIERDLELVHSSKKQKSDAGKASAEAKKNRKLAQGQRETNDRSTTVEIPLQRNSTNKDTDTEEDIYPLSPPALDESPSEDPPDTPGKPVPKRKSKSRLPDPFNVTGDMRLWASDRAPAVNLTLESEKFVNYWRGSGGTKADWEATWRTWMLKAQEDANRRLTGPPRTGARAPDFNDISWAEEQIL
jgi:uncharacterized protein YdaU (DUF1376 family)